MTDLTLQTRIRDAELSVRTANLLCKAYGEDATFSDIRAHDLDDLRRRLGQKSFREMQEVCFVVALSSHHRPDTRGTKTLRDEFAMIADRDEFGELKYRNVSRRLAEQLLGREFPQGDGVDAQFEKMKWDIEVSAKLRFMFADAMLEARDK